MDGFDELWPGGPRFRQGGFRLSTDSVLLGAFARTIRAEKIIDLGCGAGVLTVLLSAARPSARISGVEIQAEACGLCRENMAENGFDSGGIVCADLREHRCLFPAGDFDLVISNPPYFAENSGHSAPDGSRAASRDERFCTLEDLCQAAKYLCRWGGSFALVHRPERLSEIFCTMAGCGLEPKRLRLVQYREGTAPNLVLVEARRGGRPSLVIEPPLILTDGCGNDSPEVMEIYHRPTFSCKKK